MSHGFQAFYRFARDQKVIVFQVDPDRIQDEQLGPVDYSPACAELAVDWRRKYLYVSREHLHDAATLGGMIHELGHLVATWQRPEVAGELDFLGWEWQVAKRLGLRRAWGLWMLQYVMTEDGSIYGDMTPQQRYRVLRRAVLVGQEFGNIDPRGNPMRVR